jgi:hypothetical protein
MPSDHKNACHTSEEQNDNDVAVYAVEDEELVPNDGDELEAYEERPGKDGGKMKGNADSTKAAPIPIPLPWDSSLPLESAYVRT